MAGSLQRWLYFVDEHLSAEAVDYLKLGLHSEFHRYYYEVEKLDKPSLLYYFLLDRCLGKSESQALKLFLHVVRGLGGTLRGSLVVNEGFGQGSPYNVKDPGLFDIEQASANFKFFQCLLKISTKARNMALGDQLKKKFSKGRFLNMNHRHIKNLPELFLRLYQKGFIAEDNTHHLVEAFSKYKASLCLQILNSYHKSVLLQPIPLAQKMEQKYGPVNYSSSDPSSMDDSSDVVASERLFKKAFYEGTELDPIDETDPMRFSYMSTVRCPPKTKAEGNSNDDSDSDTCIVDSSETEKMIRRMDAASGQLVVNKVVLMSRPSKKSKLGSKLLISMLVAIVVVLVVISSVTLLLKVWMHLQPLSPSRITILKRSSIILKEIDSVFHKTVIIDREEDQNVTSIDFYNSGTNVDFYGLEGSCDRIYGTDNVFDVVEQVYLTKENISSFVPKYALKGSVFHFEISANIDNSSQVRFVHICAYLGSDYNKGSRRECIKLNLREGFDRYEVTAAGYYFFKVESSEEVTDYKLSITENLKVLHINTDEFLGCCINDTNSHCQFTLPLRMKYCLMAEFYFARFAVPSVELNVEVKDSRFLIMLATPLLILVLVVIGFILLCIPLCYYYCKYCSTKHSTVTIV